jgi:hypothetical protein
MRREIPLAITGVVGIIMVIQYFVPHTPFDKLDDLFSDWFFILAACAIWLGALNLLKLSVIKVWKRKKDWQYAIIIIVSWFAMAGAGFYGGREFQTPGTNFTWMYDYFYTPLSATMFALLAFFVASASYRAFRARSFLATLLLAAGFLVMMGRVLFDDLLIGVFGSLLGDARPLAYVSDIIMNYLNTAGQRAIMIGIALGTVSTALRIMLGIERSYLGGGD